MTESDTPQDLPAPTGPAAVLITPPPTKAEAFPPESLELSQRSKSDWEWTSPHTTFDQIEER